MRILVIEDQEDILENIADYLQLHGFTVDCARNGLGGLHLALTLPFELIILDIMLPGMDGLTLCQKLRRETGVHTPVIFLTARDSLRSHIHPLRQIVDKPFDPPPDSHHLRHRLLPKSGRRCNSGRDFPSASFFPLCCLPSS